MDELLDRFPTADDVKDRTCNHKCSCCGSCCTEFIPLTEKEVRKIKDYLKEHSEIKGNWLSKDETDSCHAFCPFLNKDTYRCDIYPVRPFVCRDFKCDKPKDMIEINRKAYAMRADYNSFLKENDKYVSLHYLFFGDYQFDFVYRHLVLKQMLSSNLLLRIKLKKDSFTFEEEQRILPMYVDRFIIKKGGD